MASQSVYTVVNEAAWAPLIDGVDSVTMSHRLTKEELDEQFELFLKESVSDDSVELGRAENPSCAKSSAEKTAPKPAVSWWQDDEHSGGGTGRGLLSSGKSFRKSLRKSHPIQEEDEDPGEVAVLSRDNTQTEGESTVHQGVVLIGKVCLHV
ncbi:hypothetical protein INR49_016813 [Caranx melampygus]|nr:hypothetical protein INR49_016813 [Caranx melampygus]